MAKYIDLEKYHKWLESTLYGDNCDSVGDGYCFTHECSDCYADNFGGKEDVAPVNHARFEVEEVQNLSGRAYKRTCLSCNDVVVVSESALPYEKYCRYCGAKLDGDE